MVVTRNAYIYGVLGFVGSLVFFYYLDAAVADRAWGRIWIIASLYGLLWAVSGFAFSKADTPRTYRGNLGLLYHTAATLATLLAATLATWLLDALVLSDLLWVTFGMGLSMVFHWLGTRNQPKGIDRKEAFK